MERSRDDRATAPGTSARASPSDVTAATARGVGSTPAPSELLVRKIEVLSERPRKFAPGSSTECQRACFGHPSGAPVRRLAPRGCARIESMANAFTRSTYSWITRRAHRGSARLLLLSRRLGHSDGGGADSTGAAAGAACAAAFARAAFRISSRAILRFSMSSTLVGEGSPPAKAELARRRGAKDAAATRAALRELFTEGQRHALEPQDGHVHAHGEEPQAEHALLEHRAAARAATGRLVLRDVVVRGRVSRARYWIRAFYPETLIGTGRVGRERRWRDAHLRASRAATGEQMSWEATSCMLRCAEGECDVRGRARVVARQGSDSAECVRPRRAPSQAASRPSPTRFLGSDCLPIPGTDTTINLRNPSTTV